MLEIVKEEKSMKKLRQNDKEFKTWFAPVPPNAKINLQSTRDVPHGVQALV